MDFGIQAGQTIRGGAALRHALGESIPIFLGIKRDFTEGRHNPPCFFLKSRYIANMKQKRALQIYWIAAGFFGILCIAGVPLGLLLIFLSGSWAGFVPGIALCLFAGGMAGHLGGRAVELERGLREEQMPYRFVGDCPRNSPHGSSKR